jgi:2-polyprenyl-3-methyl-5-hydroxy-6-metoxy-1,4-benzoquinol methylase
MLPQAATKQPPDAPSSDAPRRFDYTGIPLGYYDDLVQRGNPVRRLWHLSKFERVLDYLPALPHQAILDVGCFAGTFLALIPEARFERQVGVDILADQIEFASSRYKTSFRSFKHVRSMDELGRLGGKFDCVTLIEVIEHLTHDEVRSVLEHIADVLRPGGRLVLTTPNYASAWPVLEILINKLSDVSYEEQHITRFNYFNIERKLASIWPDFASRFTVDLKTTSHFITPFLAGLSYEAAHRLSRVVPHKKWRHPFGNLILMALVRR